MKKSKLVYCLIAMLIPVALFGQSRKFENIKKISLRSVYAIKEQNVVKGYYTFYFVEKADRKNNNYLLEIMDNNLKTTQSINITKPKKTYLLEGVFNGSHFCFSWLDTKEEIIVCETYDQNAVKRGTYKVTDLEKYQYMTLVSAATGDNDYSGSLIPIKDKGFAVIYNKEGKGIKYQINMFNNTGSRRWSHNSGNINKSFEGFAVLNSNEDFIIGFASSRDSKFSKKTVTSTVLIDTKSGRKVATLDWDDIKTYPAITGVSYLKDEGEIIMYGELFGNNKGTADVKNKLGFFVRTYDTKGKSKTYKEVLWKEDILPKLEAKDTEKLKSGTMSVMIHGVTKAKDGRYVAIGEQFNKEVSAGGAALNVLAAASSKSGSGVSSWKIALYDLMTFEFDAEFNLANVEIIDVRKTNLTLPQGAGYYGEEKLGYFIKSYGGFRYNFTTVNSDRSNFSSVYTVYNRGSENKDNRYSVGVVTMDSDKNVVNTLLDLKSKPTAFISLPTRPGYVAIFEYFKKEKTAEIRLEKLDL